MSVAARAVLTLGSMKASFFLALDPGRLLPGWEPEAALLDMSADMGLVGVIMRPLMRGPGLSASLDMERGRESVSRSGGTKAMVDNVLLAVGWLIERFQGLT